MKCCLKRVLGTLACGLALIAGLSGCKSSPEGGPEGIGKREALTITGFNNLINEEFIEAFCREYPEVNIELISYAGTNGSGLARHMLEHGDIPDIYISTQNFSRESQEKYLLDLSNYDFVNNYTTALLDSMDINGGIYLLPSGYQLTGIYYNKTILEENGWEVPGSFQELAALSEKIEAAGYRTMGHGTSLDGYPFNYFFNIGNTMYFSTPRGTGWKEDFPKGETAAAGNEELKETAEYFQKWVEHGFITDNHTSAEQFYQGECIFYLCLGLSDYTYTREDGKTFEFGTIPWLSEDGSNNMLTRTVSRYMGISRTLSEKGKEQKLEDALKLMRYISTQEGQKVLMASSGQYMPSLNEGTLPEDSPYQEIASCVSAGRTVPLVYVGWEQMLIPLSQNIRSMIRGELDAEGLLETFDRTAADLRNGVSEEVYAKAARTLTLEETARLVAVAQGRAAGADCALISLNRYHGDGLCNRYGLGWYIYEGNIDKDVVNMIRPRAASICVLELTGAQIRAMRDRGFDLDGNGNPYQYLLFAKDGLELDDSTVYRLAVSADELTEEMRAGAEQTGHSPTDAIIAYLREIETVNGAVPWK